MELAEVDHLGLQLQQGGTGGWGKGWTWCVNIPQDSLLPNSRAPNFSNTEVFPGKTCLLGRSNLLHASGTLSALPEKSYLHWKDARRAAERYPGGARIAGLVHDALTTAYMTDSPRCFYFPGPFPPCDTPTDLGVHVHLRIPVQSNFPQFFRPPEGNVSTLAIVCCKLRRKLMAMRMPNLPSLPTHNHHLLSAASSSASMTLSKSAQRPEVHAVPDPARRERIQAQQREASARYREKNRDQVLEAGRLRAAKRRALGRSSDRAHAREASARYRESHREELALKQRQVRKRAFIKKHGVHAFIQRRFDVPMPAPAARPDTPPPPSEEAEADETWDFWGSNNNAPVISTYDDPCLRRW
ncbi:hypothetical protein C8R43DRAFT_1137477 [Mycena crocata]|nr:hypothetical protein C8R43DRAFT_1137477 [Mycena crocata]